VVQNESKIPPWLDLPTTDEKIAETVRNEILNLTKTKRNFLNAPPEDSNFVFNFDEQVELAQACLQADKALSQARFYLVPKYIREPQFWRNYFYRVYVIKESYGLNPKISLIPTKTTKDSPGYTPQNTIMEEPKPKRNQNNDQLVHQTSQEEEFVSDHLEYQVGSSKKRDSWEEELKAELGAIDGVATQGTDIDEAWEEQMKKELEEDMAT